MTEILSFISFIFACFVDAMNEIAKTVVSTPILFLFCVIPLVGLGVGLFKRLLNV